MPDCRGSVESDQPDDQPNSLSVKLVAGWWSFGFFDLNSDRACLMVDQPPTAHFIDKDVRGGQNAAIQHFFAHDYRVLP